MIDADEINFKSFGSAIFYPEFIRMTPDIPGKMAFIHTASEVLSQKSWELQFDIRITGNNSESHGEGLALWLLSSMPSESNNQFKLSNGTMYGYDVLFPFAGFP